MWKCWNATLCINTFWFRSPQPSPILAVSKADLTPQQSSCCEPCTDPLRKQHGNCTTWCQLVNFASTVLFKTLCDRVFLFVCLVFVLFFLPRKAFVNSSSHFYPGSSGNTSPRVPSGPVVSANGAFTAQRTDNKGAGSTSTASLWVYKDRLLSMVFV